MSKTVEELLKPRYKQINDWPFMNDMYYIGKVFVFKSEIETGIVAAYPHLFKKLEWYEEITFEDFPEYIKFGNNGKPRKIKTFIPFWGSVEFEGGRRRKLNEKWLPIDQSEYDSYIQNLKK